MYTPVNKNGFGVDVPLPKYKPVPKKRYIKSKTGIVLFYFSRNSFYPPPIFLNALAQYIKFETVHRQCHADFNFSKITLDLLLLRFLKKSTFTWFVNLSTCLYASVCCSYSFSHSETSVFRNLVFRYFVRMSTLRTARIAQLVRARDLRSRHCGFDSQAGQLKITNNLSDVT